MSGPVDRDQVQRLLEQDKGRSFRSIARELGCSDWTVRSIARRVNSDPRPMKQRRSIPHDDADPSGIAGLGVLAGLVALFGGLIWLMVRAARPPEI